MSTDLTKKIALVTGGSRGVGRDVALRLAEAGADVVITYKQNAEAAAETVESLHTRGVRAEALQVDLEGTQAIAAFAESFGALLSRWGVEGFDILINNAGISGHGMIAEVSEEDVDRIYNTNYKSVVFLTQALLPTMRDGGRIVAIGSGLARFVLPGIGIYGSLKAALEMLMRYLAKELGPRGITANAVSPGALDTDFNAAAFEHNPQMRDFISSVTALGRVGLADDVGGVVAWLCSEDGRWVTGQRIEVSGGMFL